MISRAIHIVASMLREHQKRTTRSPHWPAVEKAHLKDHPSCAACGSTILLNVHHALPFHLHPELELDPKNLITLCVLNKCHVEIGHGDDFKAYVPDVRIYAEIVRTDPSKRPEVVAAARAARKFE